MRGVIRCRLAVPLVATALIATALTPVASVQAATAVTSAPRFDHVVVVVMENHSAAEIQGSAAAPYINSLMRGGANFTNSHAVTYPSEPNYLALFSGSTQGVVDDSCPHSFAGLNLGAQLRAAARTFVGYSESMPSAGYTGCQSGAYARKHNPWVNFTNLPSSVNQTMAAFPTSFASLPTVSIVVPNLLNDMHDGTIAQGDAWLKAHLSAYVTWAKAHNSILVVTWDSDDNTANNKIATVIVGAHVRIGSYPESLNHYRLLRTIQSMYGLSALGSSANYAPITDAWN